MTPFSGCGIIRYLTFFTKEQQMNSIAPYELLGLLHRVSKMARPPRPEGPCEGETVRGRGRILTTLCKEDGLSQKTLSDRLGIRPQSLSEAIVKLIDEGFVKRLPSDSDKRELLIFITDEGRKKGEEIRARRELFANDFFSPLSEKEKNSLFEIMKKLEENSKEESI